jgi:hypothetical protein
MIWVSIILASAVPMVFVIGKALRVSRERCPQAWPWRLRPSEIHLYFLVSAFAPPGCGLATALGVVPVDARVFFLLALGFLASRLLLF